MGIYLNPNTDSFLEAKESQIYVDKSMLLKYTNSVLETQQKYICVSRPRRFGKTTTAFMLSAYYGRNHDSEKLFDGLRITEEPSFSLGRGKYDVLLINMQDFLGASSNVVVLTERLVKGIVRELSEEYPDVAFSDKSLLSTVMQEINLATGRKFVVIIDEWDCIFREWKENKEAQEKYLDFLRNWLKDKSYIALAYMTGILPIKKYGTHSALNMFDEFSMENPGVLSEFVGLTEEEVKNLCESYRIDFEECKSWYNGYRFKRCKAVYNPKSIVSLMRSGEFADYWNQTESYEALRIYIEMNYDGLRDAILAMMAGEELEIDVGSFSNDMTSFTNADDVLTLLIHLGYLGYDSETKKVFIPNREVMQEFVTTTTVGGWDEIIRSVRKSENLLTATLKKDKETVGEYLEAAHLETSHIQYNDENALAYTISLAYYAARQYYTTVREFPTGKGFADMVFLPRKQYPEKPALLVELKWDRSADSAIQQIKEKRYAGQLMDYFGEVLLVGINYDKKNRKHICEIMEAVQSKV